MLTGFIVFVIIYECFENVIRFFYQTIQNVTAFSNNSLNIVANINNNFSVFNSQLSVFDQFVREPILLDT
jgi:hypothetical protein